MANTKPSNKTLYEEYDLEPATESYLLNVPLPGVSAKGFLSTVQGFWWQRYYARYLVLKYDFADAVAKDLLIARIRARNSSYSNLPDLPAEQIALAERTLGAEADISSLREIPSYGPSLISLWADAIQQGLSHEQAAKYIWDWGSYRSPAREAYYKRKAKKQPLIEPEVTSRLAEVTVWRQTGDLSIPWEAETSDHQWQVRLNDFPDEVMYTLVIEGEAVGDFLDWPQAWDRSEPKSAVKRSTKAPAARAAVKPDPTTLLDRYQKGAYEAVWRDLIALGPDVRQDPYKDAAWAVAQETMRRAAHNVRLLIERLKQLNYQFASEEWVYIPCTEEERKLFSACDRERLWVPLSLRAFREEVGRVDLVGSHPALSPMDDKGKPLITDPLEVHDCERSLESLRQEWSHTSPEDREPLSWAVSADAQGKADMLMNEQVEGSYTVQMPNAAADAVLEGEVHGIGFVEYLRLSFRWGGFPGWEKHPTRPEKELAFLREGLLSI
jgi:hypothetical protein